MTCSNCKGQWVKVRPSDKGNLWNYIDEDVANNTFEVITDAEINMIRNLDSVDFEVGIYMNKLPTHLKNDNTAYFKKYNLNLRDLILLYLCEEYIFNVIFRL